MGLSKQNELSRHQMKICNTEQLAMVNWIARRLAMQFVLEPMLINAVLRGRDFLSMETDLVFVGVVIRQPTRGRP